MKQTLLLTFLLASFLLSAQVAIDPSYIEVDFEFETGEDVEIVGYALMVNNKSTDVVYNWTKEIVYAPDGWEAAYCDKTRCWLPFVDEGSVTLGPNESGTSDVHIYNNALEGDSATVRITVTEEGNPDNTFIALYRFVNSGTTPVSDLTPDSAIRLYPNPATSYFSVRSGRDYDKVVLYNLIGRAVKTYKASSAPYSLEGLPGGMYLVRLYGDKGDVIKTIRLHKR